MISTILAETGFWRLSAQNSTMPAEDVSANHLSDVSPAFKICDVVLNKWLHQMVNQL